MVIPLILQDEQAATPSATAHSEISIFGAMNKLHASPRAILALQQSSRAAFAVKQIGADQVPQAWIRTVTPFPKGPLWVRMITFAIDPISGHPCVTVTDLMRTASGGVLYVENERFSRALYSDSAFMGELARVIAGAQRVPYLEAEALARTRLQEVTPGQALAS